MAEKWHDEIESGAVIFIGLPSEFFQASEERLEAMQLPDVEGNYDIIENALYVELYSCIQNKIFASFSITPLTLPNSRCRLVLNIEFGDRAIVLMQVAKLIDSLYADGWIEVSSQPSAVEQPTTADTEQVIKTSERVEQVPGERVDAVPQLPLAPSAGELTTNKVLKCNQWLFVEYFDKGHTNLKELEGDWRRIHKEQDYKTQIANAIASMRTAIHEERKRRNS